MLAEPFARYDCFLFDLDGVLYRGDQVVSGAPAALAALREAGRRVVFMTNNSARTPEEVAATLEGLDIEAHTEEIETSALATAGMLAARGGGTAFVIGRRGLLDALANAGIHVVDGAAGRVDHVVVGWDADADYAKLRDACLLIQRGADLIATNADASYPSPDGLWPRAGALLAVVTTTTGAIPEVVGKPNPPLFEAALARAGGGRPLVVGDRIETDIAGADALGWDSLLVLTGVTSRADLDGASVRPTYVADSLADLCGPSP